MNVACCVSLYFCFVVLMFMLLVLCVLLDLCVMYVFVCILCVVCVVLYVLLFVALWFVLALCCLLCWYIIMFVYCKNNASIMPNFARLRARENFAQLRIGSRKIPNHFSRFHKNIFSLMTMQTLYIHSCNIKFDCTNGTIAISDSRKVFCSNL